MLTLIAALTLAQTPSDSPPEFVVVSVANLRDGPDVNAKLRLKLQNGQRVTLVEEKSGWSRVIAGRCQGWLQSDSLRDEEVDRSFLVKQAEAVKDKPAERKSWLERAAARAPLDPLVLAPLVDVLTQLNDKALASTKAGLDVARSAWEYDRARNLDPGSGRAVLVVKDKVPVRDDSNAKAAVIRTYNTGDLIAIEGHAVNGMLPVTLQQPGIGWIDPKAVAEFSDLRGFISGTFEIDESFKAPKGTDLGSLAYFTRASHNPNPEARSHAAYRVLDMIKDPKQLAETWASFQRDYHAMVRLAAAAKLLDLTLNAEQEAALAPKVKEAIAKYTALAGARDGDSLQALSRKLKIDDKATKILLTNAGLYCP